MGVDRRTRRRARAGLLTVAAAGCLVLQSPALAAPGDGPHAHNITGLAISIGLTAFAVILSLIHLGEWDCARMLVRTRPATDGLKAEAVGAVLDMAPLMQAPATAYADAPRHALAAAPLPAR